jgi:hypothetical protein
MERTLKGAYGEYVEGFDSWLRFPLFGSANLAPVVSLWFDSSV